MYGGGENRGMPMDTTEPHSPMPINSRALVVSDFPVHSYGNQNPNPFSREDTNMHNGAPKQNAEPMASRSKKLEDDMQKIGKQIKHHEDNIKYLRSLINECDEQILELQVSIGKYHTTSSGKSDNPAPVEEEMIQKILNGSVSAAGLICRMKSKLEDHVSDHPLIKDVLGIVATLGKVDDANLSGLLSQYLGQETMLAVVCKNFEGVKALESYNTDGSVNKGSGIHAIAAHAGSPLDDRFLVICLENLRPYVGKVIANDPQRRLDLVKPRLLNGQHPPGFLGFAVNMITIDYPDLYSMTGPSLRETLFYKLFSNLQVYRTKEEMINALVVITNGAISLDGGIVKSRGVFSLGHHCGDTYVKFPSGSEIPTVPQEYVEMETRMRDTKWKKDRALQDIATEEAVLNQSRFKYETMKREFVQFLAESSAYAAQVGRASTPR